MEVLVLNKAWLPIRTVSVFVAIDKVYRNKAKFMSEDFSLHTWEQWISHSKNNPSKERINGVSFFINKPFVIVQTVGTTKYRTPKVSRKNVFIRDDFTCQYCGKKFSSKELTIDHVVPKSRGGKLTWENSVTSCSKCNNIKSDKSVENSGMSLLRKPFVPTYTGLFIGSVKLEKWRNVIKKLGA